MNRILLSCVVETILYSLVASEGNEPSLHNTSSSTTPFLPTPSLVKHEDTRTFTILKGYKDRLLYPYFVSTFMCNSVTNKCRALCGGSILSRKMVLTACHCTMDTVNNRLVYKDVRNIGVVAGIGLWKQIGWVKRIHPHPKCWIWRKPVINDVAILVLQTAFAFNQIVQPINFYSTTPGKSMMELYRLAFSRTKCIALSEGEHPNTIKVIDVIPMSTPVCQRIFCANGHNQMCNYDFQTYGQVCAAVRDGMVPCSSKGGGPLVCNGAIYGIVSHNPHCGYTRLPMIFAHIESVQFLLARHAPELIRMRSGSTKIAIPTCLTTVILLVYNTFKASK